jgi:hypothetical protein
MVPSPPRRGQEQGLHRIVHIGEISQLLTFPHLEVLTFEKETDPDPEKGLPGVLHPHPRAVRVRQPEGTGTQVVDIVIQDVIPLPGHLVDPVDVHGAQEVFFIDG